MSLAFLGTLLASARGTHSVSEKLCQWSGHHCVMGLCGPVLFVFSPETLPTVKLLWKTIIDCPRLHKWTWFTGSHVRIPRFSRHVVVVRTINSVSPAQMHVCNEVMSASYNLVKIHLKLLKYIMTKRIYYYVSFEHVSPPAGFFPKCVLPLWYPWYKATAL